jgi:hypothetical protein
MKWVAGAQNVFCLRGLGFWKKFALSFSVAVVWVAREKYLVVSIYDSTIIQSTFHLKSRLGCIFTVITQF